MNASAVVERVEFRALLMSVGSQGFRRIALSLGSLDYGSRMRRLSRANWPRVNLADIRAIDV